jgi:hypothetical protein
MNTPAWKHELVDRLAAQIPAGYAADGEPACEPTALVGLALAECGRIDAARLAAKWLAERQSRDGSVGVTESRSSPNWPTAWAMMLWHSVVKSEAGREFDGNLRPAIDWALAERGKTAPNNAQVGHDSMLVGWSWAANTHSWLEPTAMFVIALKLVGESHHPRTREGVRLLVDRQLPRGGCNYGNTIVLGQPLLAHVQPTGLAMIALAGETNDDSRTERSLAYLQGELSANSATASLCYGILGLAAHGRAPQSHDAWLQSATARAIKQGGSPYKMALLALAASNEKSILLNPTMVSLMQRR